MDTEIQKLHHGEGGDSGFHVNCGVDMGHPKLPNDQYRYWTSQYAVLELDFRLAYCVVQVLLSSCIPTRFLCPTDSL